MLYIVYAVPNCIMPLLSSILLERIGMRSGLIGFTGLLCLGQGILMWGGYNSSITLMLVGRATFGIGCESMYVGQSAIISEWFINYELGFAFTMISCFPLIGSFLDGAISTWKFE